MASTEHYLNAEDIHPIDIVEHLASVNEWDFDRVSDEQIAMAIEGIWKTYSLSLAWSGQDETLRSICTFEMDLPSEALPQLYEALDHANDMCWTGAFTYWREQKLMVFRYGLNLVGGASASPDQIDAMVHTAVQACERFYPAFQLVAWSGHSPAEAMRVALTEAYGRA